MNNDFKIYFSQLEKDKTKYSFTIKDDFFPNLDNEEFSNPDIQCNIFVESHALEFKMEISIEGEVDLICDITSEIFRNKISNKINFIIKFGDYFSDEDLDIIYLPRGENVLDVKKYIYECVLFSIPFKKRHPMLEDFKFREDHKLMLDNIEGYNKKKMNNNILGSKLKDIKESE